MKPTESAQVERVAKFLIKLAPEMHNTKSDLIAHIGKELDLNKEVVKRYVRMMKAIKYDTPFHDPGYTDLLNRVKKECTLNAGFKENIINAITLYEPYDPFSTTEQIIECITALTNNKTLERGELNKRIAAELKLDVSTVLNHLETIHALQGTTQPNKAHTKHYPYLKTMYDNDCRFKKRVVDALNVYDNTADMRLMDNILKDIITCAPKCRKGRKALNAYVAEHNGITADHVFNYILMMKTLAGYPKTKLRSLKTTVPAYKNRYAKDETFRINIKDAIEKYDALKQREPISWNELVNAVGISLTHTNKNSTENEKMKYVLTDLLLSVRQDAILSLAKLRNREYDQLIKEAIEVAEKQQPST